MKKNNKQLYIKLSAILCLFAFALIPSFKLNNAVKNDSTNRTAAPISIKKNTISVTILAGSTTTHLSPSPNTLLYNALVQGKNAGSITFSGENYPGLGFFVTDIGALHSGNGKNLIYYINGKEATVGVSSYTLKDGNIILWKLE